jgi:hypothetical protein
MFSYLFALRPSLLVCGNLCQFASKQTTHLQLVAEHWGLQACRLKTRGGRIGEHAFPSLEYIMFLIYVSIYMQMAESLYVNGGRSFQLCFQWTDAFSL